MIINLIKALFAPTQYIYQKDSVQLSSQIPSEPRAQTHPILKPTNVPTTPAPQVANQTVQSTPAQVPRPEPTSSPTIQMPAPAPTPPPSYGPVVELSPSPRPVLSGNLDDLVNEKKQDEGSLSAEE